MFPGYTMAELELQARRRADMENSTFVGQQEVFDAINKSADKLLEKIASLAEDLLIKKNTITTVAGTAEYELAADVMKLRKIAFRTVGSDDVPLERRAHDFVESTIAQSWGYAFLPSYRARIATGASGKLVWKLDFNPPPNAVYTLPYEYIWGWTATSSSATLVELPFPEYIVLDVAIALLQKEKSSATELVQEREILEKRIEAWLEPKDHHRGAHILDVRDTEGWGYL